MLKNKSDQDSVDLRGRPILEEIARGEINAPGAMRGADN